MSIQEISFVNFQWMMRPSWWCLTHKNKKHFNYDDGSFIMLISFNENENDEELHESQTPWLLQHLKLKKSIKIQLV
jgi:hypothetical protein